MNKIIRYRLSWYRLKRRAGEIDLDLSSFNVYGHVIYHPGAGARKLREQKYFLPSHKSIIHKEMSDEEFDEFTTRPGELHRRMIKLIATDEEFIVATRSKLPLNEFGREN